MRIAICALGTVLFASLGLASFAGDGLSARLAMNGYPDLAHSFEANEGR